MVGVRRRRLTTGQKVTLGVAAAVAVGLPGWFLAQSYLGKRDAALFLAREATVDGPPCPSLTKAQFEAFWGRTLGANVVYINSGDAMPQINGDEQYNLYNAAGTRIDGQTIGMAASAGEALQRIRPCSGANKASSWSRAASTAATPGSGAVAPCGKGVYIAEFSDATGTGNFIYEYVELYNDK